jgi:NhaA family Na+:H+ antiporter
VGVLAVFGRRLPKGVRLFLLALAIVDDIGAILVIALYYSGGINAWALGAATLIVGVVLGSRLLGLRVVALYVALGAGLWLALREAGVHPTIAGVILGLLTPVVPFQPPAGVSWVARRVADETLDDPQPPDLDSPRWLYLAALAREAAPPSARLESVLHPWSSFVILPLFALANAGVDIGGVLRMSGIGSVGVAIALALVVGKALGIAGGAFLAVRLGAARLPPETAWPELIGASIVAGIGFTVALFVTQLAFTDPAMAGQAKLGVLAGSAIAALAGALVLVRVQERLKPQ